MATAFNEANFEKKLSNAANTQDGIQTLSLWIIHHKAHFQKIVEMWLKVMKRAKMSHRLTLFNLANDVIQNSRRKGFSKFVESFGEVLKAATPLVRDDKVAPAVLRIYKIWEERSIYSSEVIKELNDILDKKAAADRLIADFKLVSLVDQIRMCVKLQINVKSKYQVMKNQKVDASSLETLSAVKDRILGRQFETDFEESTQSLEEYVNMLTNDVKEQKKLLELLEEAIVYYDSQRNEAKIVANAYKNFAGKIKVIKKKLGEKMESLPSPVASPNPNAPSPSPSETTEDIFGEHQEKGGESPPSPEGTPEEFRFSPQTSTEEIPGISSLPTTSVADNVLKTINSISILSNQAQSDGSTAISLDSRLTDLMVHGLPQGLFGTLFSNTGTINNSNEDKNNLSVTAVAEGTPLNDEPAGHETPLQDEPDAESPTNNISQVKESNEKQQMGIPLPNLVSNVVPNWSKPDMNTNWPNESASSYSSSSSFPWDVAKVANAYADKDERVLKGVDVEPMDMELDDDEMEDAPGVIIESASMPNNVLASNGQLDNTDNNSDARNLITVLDQNSRPPLFDESPPVMTPSAPSTNSHNMSHESIDVPDPIQNVEPVENENDLYQDTQRLIEQQLSSDDHCDSANDDSEPYQDYPNQSYPPSEQTYRNDRPGLISYPDRQFHPSQNSNYHSYGNNNWANNISVPRRPFRGSPRASHSYSPYRLPPPPRWRY
ncbi:Regulation of nuclear pre-mRNA domain-containing protein 2 [Nymphon striatum]|nr:Regulation of nuclear pre-mRNA domain-containing protein 2 [Nymphon striatum]